MRFPWDQQAGGPRWSRPACCERVSWPVRVGRGQLTIHPMGWVVNGIGADGSWLQKRLLQQSCMPRSIVPEARVRPMLPVYSGDCEPAGDGSFLCSGMTTFEGCNPCPGRLPCTQCRTACGRVSPLPMQILLLA